MNLPHEVLYLQPVLTLVTHLQRVITAIKIMISTNPATEITIFPLFVFMSQSIGSSSAFLVTTGRTLVGLNAEKSILLVTSGKTSVAFDNENCTLLVPTEKIWVALDTENGTLFVPTGKTLVGLVEVVIEKSIVLVLLFLLHESPVHPCKQIFSPVVLLQS